MDLVVAAAYRSVGIGHEALRVGCKPLLVSRIIVVPDLRSHLPFLLQTYGGGGGS